jgi:hypothetical protein
MFGTALPVVELTAWHTSDLQVCCAAAEHVCVYVCEVQIYFYFYSLLRAAVVSHNRKLRGLPAVAAGSPAGRQEDIGVAASLLVAAVAGAVNMLFTTPAQVCSAVAAAACVSGFCLWWFSCGCGPVVVCCRWCPLRCKPQQP